MFHYTIITILKFEYLNYILTHGFNFLKLKLNVLIHLGLNRVEKKKCYHSFYFILLLLVNNV